MANFTKPLPEWKSKGTEPPQVLKDTGWKVSQKPPATYFDWFFNRTYEALKELQETATAGNTLGNTAELTTTEKTSIVKAINEINEILKVNSSPHRDAINIAIKDVGGMFTAADVEGVFQEVGTKLKETDTKLAETDKKLKAHVEPLSRFGSDEDDRGIYRVLEWKTKSGKLRRKSILSDADAEGIYRKQTVTEYKEDGVTVDTTDVYTLIPGLNGNVKDEVLQ
ncbi:hypothetical protein WBS46_16875 [Bacillus albus]|uniref:hypothetical protein n=1 Tax=Bacillus albus TaxID=2026189 RepID=UPI001009F941|nr:hypothetical protein [Bacillus albus]RXJ19853.1 hypothetical protein ETJ91_00335 [Bacillus albus]RXJ30070.1 hypothetical protein ETJ76_15755 [Bacillus albus]RXJ31662.1 hypothetical protein ETJ90_08530 [Bacillus albus]RXJ42886.1 hypothetical protein ETJ89_08535 [Bacillus albus]RXJ59814.1 hypothetical protein ETJ66_08530 [Bacillus albus]